jgi:nucleoid-associated protein YgaU
MASLYEQPVFDFHAEHPDTAGLFGSIGKAFKSVGKAVGKVAAATTKVALAPVTLSAKAVGKVTKNIPVLGGIVGAVNQVALMPINVTQGVLEGGRIDKVALSNLKQTISSVTTLGPYVQTVLSLVPGIGTGVSAAIGAGLALAEGKSISDAMIAGVKGAIPGGPAAQMAFSVAKAAIERKPIDQIAIAALPISDAQKKLLSQGLSAVKDIASGKNVAHSLVDNAVKSLPPQYAKAVQIGMAMGHAKSLQEALKTGAKGALSVAAPKAIASLPSGVTNIVNNVAKGLPLSAADIATLAKNKMTPAAALALAKKNLPTKVIGVVNPMRSPIFKRAGSLPIVSLARQPAKLSAIPSATKAVVDAVRHNPSLMASSRQLLAQGMRTNAATVNDAMAILSRQRTLLPWRSMAPHTVAFIRRYAPNAPLTALRHAHTNVGGLDSSGTVYIVEKGDGPWAIAQKLTGNGNRWKELLDYNKDKNPKIDKNVWVGEPINLPPSWQKPTVRANPNTPALPTVPPPSIGPVNPVTQVTTAATSIVPSILQAKAILAAWGKTDGINQSGLPDYGLNPADMSTSMGPRDTMMLQSFQVWDNKTLNDGLPVDGNLDAKTLTALQGWAQARATSAVPSSPTVSVGIPTAPSIPQVLPAIVGGTDSVLPTITVTPTKPVSATPTVATAAKPATGGGGTAIAVGAVVGGLLFGLPGALVGAAGGAAVS